MRPETIASQLMRERPTLLAWTWAIVRDHHLAEDILQEVAVEVMRKHDEINDAEHLGRWLRRAARLRGIDALRRRGRGPAPLSDETLDALAEAWPPADAASPRMEALRACLAQLGAYARRLVALRYREGLSGQALADALDRKLNTVQVALSRAHGQLADCVRQRLAASR